MNENIAELMLNSLFNSFWLIFKETWWFWLILLIIWLVATILPELKNKILREKKFAGIEAINNARKMLYNLRKLKPWEFEEYIASLYSKLGYATERVGQSHDGGIDIITEKDGVKHYIQCKKFITKKVRATDIRDFYGAISSKLANGNGIFITTNYFTTEARKFAEDNMIEIIDGYALLKLIKLVGNEAKIDIDNSKNETSLKKGNCPKCEGELILRRSKFGSFYGCSNYPKCKFIKNV